ncbi:Proton-dependent oligopeptide transporter family [Canna indica]|uniref:Proton-dependent oligopeptide transporter family n=1 Tax=Canna indica TaxID=4628 RepID=A0AAQ3KFS1_9LILI|nr:Proton-dependent oligopeptide transporter family [Canna indica]
MATLGTLGNLLVYLTSEFHLSSVAAATALNVFNGTTNLATFLGAFVSDSFLGRYTTLAYASIASVFGMAVIALTAIFPSLHPPRCEEGETCVAPTQGQLAMLILSFVFLVIGSGGIRPCSVTFGADQFDPNTESGKRGINSFFNWYYFTLTIAVAISSTLIIYIQSNVSWALGFAIPTVLMILSCVFFFAASRIYVKVQPEGSPVTSIIKVTVAAIKKRAVKCLDKAAVITPADEVESSGLSGNPWSLCSMQQVEEVKCLVRIIPIWSSCIIYYLAIAQQTTYVVFQALQSDRRIKNFEVPGASFTIFSSIALSVWIPIYDRIIVPLIRHFTKKDDGISLLQRMGIGIVLSTAAMFVSGFVEERRQRVALHQPTIGTAAGGGAVSAMSSFWLVPQLLLLGISEAFNLVSQLEFYYKQFPENMRSVAGSLLFCGIAISCYLSGSMVSIVQRTTAAKGCDWLAQDLNEGRLEFFYYLIGAISSINFVYFIFCAKWFRYKDESAEDSGDKLERSCSIAHSLSKERESSSLCCCGRPGNETFERVASYGLTANFTVYLVERLHIREVSAANVVNIFTGTTNFAPLLGAFIADAYCGRFRTLAYASIATFLGMMVLTLTAAVPQLQPPSCSSTATEQSQGPSHLQLGVLFLSLVLLVVGSGGVRPCSLPFGVDQFDSTTERGRRGLNSFVNWYYCSSTAAVVAGMTVVVYVQDSISWPIGFGIPTGLMLLAIVFFFAGMRLYIYVPPEGSVFSGITQVFVAAFRKRNLPLPASRDPAELEMLLYNKLARKRDRVMKLPLTLQFKFLNKAAIICEGEMKEDGFAVNPWRLCSVQQIEEVKCLIRIVPIWASGIICFLSLTQQWTIAVLQSLRMDRHLGRHFQIPPGSLGIISLVALTLFIPIYDRAFVPIARRLTGIESGITLLQRQGVGLAIGVVSMAVAGLVEKRRRESALADGGPNGLSPMSAMWLAPQLSLMGIAEAFNAVGQIEFYNREFPEHLQSLANSLFYCTVAGANYLSAVLIAVVQKSTTGSGGRSWLDNNINLGRVDYFYYVIGALGVINMIFFFICAHYYRYKGTPDMKGRSKDVEISVKKLETEMI